MDFGLKEMAVTGGFLLTWTGFIATISTIWNKFSNRVDNVEKDVSKLSQFFKKVVLDDNGEIRLVDRKTFEAHIIEGRQTTLDTNRQLKNMDDKLILIIYHLNIEMEDSKALKLKDRP